MSQWPLLWLLGCIQTKSGAACVAVWECQYVAHLCDVINFFVLPHGKGCSVWSPAYLIRDRRVTSGWVSSKVDLKKLKKCKHPPVVSSTRALSGECLFCRNAWFSLNAALFTVAVYVRNTFRPHRREFVHNIYFACWVACVCLRRSQKLFTQSAV